MSVIATSIDAVPAIAGDNKAWEQLPSVPDPIGFAAPFAGVSGNALIVAGGANFPDRMPWEGGQKIWHDSVFVLPKPDGKWISGFKLPRPLGYGVSVSTTDGVVCAGGSDSKEHVRDVFIMRWADGKIDFRNLEPLPKPLANACGALVGNTLYVAGGIEKPDATNSMNHFWAMDLSAKKPEWRVLESWPGPARMLSVAGSHDGKFYLFSGVELSGDAQGKPVRRYLKDAYCYEPSKGWKRLADLPRAVVAAPSPAIARNDALMIVSGDDGALVNFEPKSKHPGFPKEMIAYDVKRDKWSNVGEMPITRATAPVVQWEKRAVIVNGEVGPGRRTPEIWTLSTKPTPKR